MEAQCAVLFEKLGWEWEYEPYSVMLPSGISYIPDFRVNCESVSSMIVECRGYENERSVRQIEDFACLASSGEYVIDAERGIIAHYLVIGPADAYYYPFGQRTKRILSVPAKDRRMWGSLWPAVVARCGC